MCTDPKPLNKAFKRNHFPLPGMEELLPKLTSAKVFSVADAKNKFWQVELNGESSFLTTLGNTWGRYHWTRMPFGISPEQFRQKNSREDLSKLWRVWMESFSSLISSCLVWVTQKKKHCLATRIKVNRDKLKLCLLEVKFWDMCYPKID